VTPDQALRLLSVKQWPPRLEHWPPRDKRQWRVGMSLVGRIEAVMALPRPDGSKKRGEPYTALYVRREGDGRLVMFHGWHTAAEDLDGMHPAPGLLFAAYYRGEEDSGFENFKYLVAPFDDPPAQQTRQETGQAERHRSAQAPEAGEGEHSPASASTKRYVELPAITNTDQAKAYVRAQNHRWQAEFRHQAEFAKEAGTLGNLSPLEMWLELIRRTWAQQGISARTRDAAA
jgi:hypothetical protein